MDQLGISQLVILFGVGIVAGLIEATAGGSGLVVLPTLLMIGIPPIPAMATSKFQYAFGAVVAIWRFIAAGLVSWRAYLPLIISSLIAGAAGAFVLTQLNSDLIASIVPVLLVAAAIYFALSPDLRDSDRAPRLGIIGMALLPIPIIAFYDGFFGAGSASLFVMAFVTLRGYNVRRATAVTKIVDCASGTAALVVLAWGGHVLLIPGLALAMGQGIGAYIGAGLVIKLGAKWVRPILVVVTIALSIKLFIDHHEKLLSYF